MARFRRMEVLEAMYGTGLVPIFYHGDPEVGMVAAAACAEGGSRLLEFTHRGDRAHLVFAQLAERCEKAHPGLILGAGSIGDPETAALYLAAGASFIVAPNLSEGVARLANRRKVAYVPGCGSATEIAAAEELGSEIVKLFPADALGGTRFVEALRGPSPWSSLMPTSGIDLTEESVREWIRSGVACLGMGSKLISKEVLARRDGPELVRRVQNVLGWIRAARAESGSTRAPR
jgi:2-dehydro-3-deoxyphosphogluconate aldolase/(4S)-4-hydroxy-2-oxoglutarate aldolase